MIVQENINFERGIDPKEAMGIGRIVNILGKEEKTEYRALILYSLKNSKELEKRNPNSIDIGSMVFRAEIQNGDQKGEKFIVRKFDEPFGKFWGLEWNLNLELELGESLNFERGMDPKKAMNVGIANKRNFNDDQEAAEWAYLFPEICSDGMIKNWKEAVDKKWQLAASGLKYDKTSFYISLKLQIVKWFKSNINSAGEYVGLKEAKDIFDLLEAIINDKHSISEKFERSLNPKESMGIGLQKQITKSLWGLTQEKGTGSINLMKNRDSVWLKIDDYNDSDTFIKNIHKHFGTEFFSDIEQKNFQKKGGSWRITFHLIIKPKYWNVFKRAFTPEGLIKESLNFERSGNPKKSLRIGIHNLIPQIIEKFKEEDQFELSRRDEVLDLTLNYELSPEIFHNPAGYPKHDWEFIGRIGDFIVSILYMIDLSNSEILRKMKVSNPNIDAEYIDNQNWKITSMSSDKIYEEINQDYVLIDIADAAEYLWDAYQKEVEEEGSFDNEEILEHVDFQRGQDPKDAMQIGAQFKKHLIQKMEQSYHRGFSAQNKEDWGFTPQLWQATLKKILYPDTKIQITDQYILIHAPSFTHRHINLITNSLNYDTDWHIKGQEWNDTTKKGKLTFASSKITNESINFERRQDPKDAMDIGRVEERKIKNSIEKLLKTFNLNITIKDESDDHKIKFSFKPDEWTYFISYQLEQYRNLYDVGFQGNPGKDNYKDIVCSSLDLAIESLEDWLLDDYKRITESINFERGQDPKDAMKIGRVEERKQKLIAEIIDYNPEDWTGSSVLSDYITRVRYPGWNISALEEASMEELQRALKYLQKWDEVEKKQAEQRIEKYNESMNFERGQEPKKAMNIGWGGFLIRNIQGLEHEGYTYDINNKEIAKIIRENIPEISDNELRRFMAFTLDDILDKISAIDFREKNYKNITWYINDQITAQSRYWMSIHGDKSMKQAMRNSGINI